MAFCAAAAGLSLLALIQPTVPSPRIRALLAFLAAPSALLYGYTMWGAIKEMTAAFLLALGVALAAVVLTRPPSGTRRSASGPTRSAISASQTADS
jgi:hypothetical protein